MNRIKKFLAFMLAFIIVGTILPIQTSAADQTTWHGNEYSLFELTNNRKTVSQKDSSNVTNNTSGAQYTFYVRKTSNSNTLNVTIYRGINDEHRWWRWGRANDPLGNDNPNPDGYDSTTLPAPTGFSGRVMPSAGLESNEEPIVNSSKRQRKWIALKVHYSYCYQWSGRGGNSHARINIDTTLPAGTTAQLWSGNGTPTDGAWLYTNTTDWVEYGGLVRNTFIIAERKDVVYDLKGGNVNGDTNNQGYICWTTGNANTSQVHDTISAPTRDGYIFKGWKCVANDGNTNLTVGTVYQNTTSFAVLSNVRFEAEWEPLYFNVVHVKDGVAGDPVPFAVPDYSVFDITSCVDSGYLYGGMYTDNTFTTPVTAICGKEIVPEAGKTYYLREVSDGYLIHKVLFIYDSGNSGTGTTKQYKTNEYLLTGIDKEGVDKNFYQGYGYSLDSGAELKGAVQLKDEDTKIEGGSYFLYDSITVHYESPNKDDSVYEFSSVYPGLTGYFGCVLVDEDTSEAGFGFASYYITADGVKVTGTRHTTIPALDPTKTHPGSTHEAATSTTSKWVQPLLAARPKLYVSRNSYGYPPVPVVVTNTITMIDGETVTTIETKPGDVHELLPTEKEGYRFAGWYQDKEFKVPADLSDVQSDMTVYARYISDSYFAVNCEILGKQSNPKSFHASCMADSDAYTEFGFEVTANGKTEKIAGVVEKKPEQKAQVLGSTKRVENKKNDKNTEIKITADVSVKGYAAGTEIEIKPYYVTADGTVCYGSSQTILCQKNGIKF